MKNVLAIPEIIRLAKKEHRPAQFLVKRALSFLLILTLCIGFAGCDNSDYEEAVVLYHEGKYLEASAIFDNLGDYENSAQMAKSSKYCHAVNLFKTEGYEDAFEYFNALGNYEQSELLAKESKY